MADQEGLIPDSKERVAFDLMNIISSSESEIKDRDYFLKLYCQCYRAISGHKIESILNKDVW